MDMREEKMQSEKSMKTISEDKRAVAPYQHIRHTFEPIYNEYSEILILGSLPSVKSREQGFYYGHPRNRFWKVMAAVLECAEPVTIEEKKAMLLANHVAIWDVIDSCDIRGSSDSSIRNVVPADIQRVLEGAPVKRIYANGKTAGQLYRKWVQPVTGCEIIDLPSTSPANAAMSLEKLVEAWRDAGCATCHAFQNMIR